MALKILIVGSESLDFVAELLREEGLIVSRVYARKRSLYLDVVPKFDIVYGEYLMNGARVAKISKLLRKRFVLHIIGTDALRYATEKFSWRWFTWLSGLAMTSKILYAAENLQRLVGFRGTILPLPVNTRLFKKRDWAGEMRDILYYSPNDDPTYRPDWIVQYALNNPKEKITVLGDLGQRIIPVNIRTIPAIRQSDMPAIYSSHRKLIRMTTHDGTPRMIYEALLCGLDVVWNGTKVSSVPSDILPEYFLAKFKEEVLESNQL